MLFISFVAFRCPKIEALALELPKDYEEYENAEEYLNELGLNCDGNPLVARSKSLTDDMTYTRFWVEKGEKLGLRQRLISTNDGNPNFSSPPRKQKPSCDDSTNKVKRNQLKSVAGKFRVIFYDNVVISYNFTEHSFAQNTYVGKMASISFAREE